MACMTSENNLSEIWYVFRSPRKNKQLALALEPVSPDDSSAVFSFRHPEGMLPPIFRNVDVRINRLQLASLVGTIGVTEPWRRKQVLSGPSRIDGGYSQRERRQELNNL
jgi:hypothetical protein